MGERERASERKQRHKSTTKYLGWNEKISLWNETASLSLSSQSLIDVLFRLMNYARKVTICRYLGIGSTRKLFTGKKKTIFKLPIAIYFPLHSHNLALTHSPPTLSITFERSRKRRRIRSKFETFHYIQQKQQLNLKAKKKIRYHSSMNRILYTFSIQLLYFICVSLLCYWVPAHLLWIME